MARLVVTEGERRLLVFELRAAGTAVGRADRCDLALPSEAVSRQHFVVDTDGTRHGVTDTSTHGTRVNGRPVPRGTRRELAEGDEIAFGPYRATFRATAPDTVPTPSFALAAWEELVEVSPAGAATGRAELAVLAGPRAGLTLHLNAVRTSLGGAGSAVALSDDLPADAAYVRVSLGRAMIEPGAVPCFLDGLRVTDLTPILPGDPLQLGVHTFTVRHTVVDSVPSAPESLAGLVGSSAEMRRVHGTLRLLARHQDPVLILGESGTGKELVARALHDGGARRDGPYFAINAAAVGETGFESELFGHEEGAFPRATERRDGVFHRAAGGTVFIDEIGALGLGLQAKLLRVLESGEVRRVGATTAEYPDVRVVAATNRDLPSMVHLGTFRRDLYHRLAILLVSLPPLRRRREDVPELARTLLARHHPDVRIGADAIEKLHAHPWPGNVRELRNVLTRAAVSCRDQRIGPEDIVVDPFAFENAPTLHASEADADPRDRAYDADELRALIARHGSRRKAADALDIPWTTFRRRLKALALTSDD